MATVDEGDAAVLKINRWKGEEYAAMFRGSEPINQIGVRVYLLNVSTHVVLKVHEAQEVVAPYPNGAICRSCYFWQTKQMAHRVQICARFPATARSAGVSPRYRCLALSRSISSLYSLRVRWLADAPALKTPTTDSIKSLEQMPRYCTDGRDVSAKEVKEETMGTKKANPPHEAVELSWIANAYLDSAERLCAKLVADNLDDSAYHYRVPLHLAFLGLELFFKAGICAAGHQYPRHHDLVKLRTLYIEVMPDVPIAIPNYFEMQRHDSLDLFDDFPTVDLQWHFARLRYASDRNGRRFPKHEFADLKEFQRELDTLTYSTQRLHFKILRQFGLL
jgi:hypothetical protein